MTQTGALSSVVCVTGVFYLSDEGMANFHTVPAAGRELVTCVVSGTEKMSTDHRELQETCHPSPIESQRRAIALLIVSLK